MAEEKTVRWDEIKHKVWLKNTWNKVKDKAARAGNWILEHPIEAATLGGVAASIVSKGTKAYCTHAETVRRNRDFYDPRTGRHVYAKRNLKGWEEELIDERYNNGESYVSIFRDLNLMK